MGNIIGFNPCRYCKEQHRCKMCELQMYRDGVIKNSEWISVEERLPENCQDCLLLLDDEQIVMGWYRRDVNYFVEGGMVLFKAVTHWMPLPEAPKMKGGEE